jgi:hypothetical protein
MAIETNTNCPTATGRAIPINTELFRAAPYMGTMPCTIASNSATMIVKLPISGIIMVLLPIDLN